MSQTQAATAHTQEPRYVEMHPLVSTLAYIRRCGGEAVCERPIAIADALRIVACVNACGPAGAVSDVLAALREQRDTGLCPMSRDEMIVELAALATTA